MRETIKLTLSPHPDIELNTARDEIEAFLTLPKDEMNAETGLIMVVDGFGGFANSQYQNNEVRPYLADKYNCAVAGVNYFGIQRGNSIQVNEGFYHNINKIYGLGLRKEELDNVKDANEFFVRIASRVIAKGVINLDMRCQPILVTGKGEYQSWGLLPAIDCLQALGEILRRYEINRKKIIVYGHSYGGYIASMMGKFAPHTISAVVDKGGYTKTELRHVAGGEIMEPDHIVSIPISDFPANFIISTAANNPWTIEDEMSPNYFSDSHRKIRNLLLEEQRVLSETKYYIFHSEKDGLVPVADKDKYVEVLQKYNPVHYKRVCEDDLEGGIFKNLENAMGVSHGELFDLVAGLDREGLQKKSEDNDFSLNNVHTFRCGEKDYVFTYSDDCVLQVSIQPGAGKI